MRIYTIIRTQLYALAAMFTVPTPVLVPARVRSRKAITFVEYALLAAAAVAVALLFRTRLKEVLEQIVSNIKGALD